MIAASERGVEKGNITESSQVDFLASIEVVIADQCGSLLMQNWQHTLDVLSVLNRAPKKIHATTDFSRVRHWALDGQDDAKSKAKGTAGSNVGKFYRQFIAIAPFVDAELRATFHKHAASMSGGMRVVPQYLTDDRIKTFEDATTGEEVSLFLFCSVPPTFYFANPAHNVTRSP